MLRRKNPNYDITSADPGISFRWIPASSTLAVSGSGSCEISTVRGSIETLDGVTVIVGSLDQNAYSRQSSNLKVSYCYGDVNSHDKSVLKAEEVRGHARSFGESQLSVRSCIRASSFESSLLKAVTVHGNATTWGLSTLHAADIRGKAISNHTSKLDANVGRGKTNQHQKSILNIETHDSDAEPPASSETDPPGPKL
jgi:hypothetical protein